MAARNIFFWMHLVEFESSFVAFVRNSEKTDAMNRTGGGAEFGKMKTKLVPGKIEQAKKR